MTTKKNTTESTATHNPATAVQSELFAMAHRRAMPAASALAESELQPFNANVPYWLSVILTYLPTMQTLRAGMLTIGHFDVSNLDELETRVLALAYAHSQCLAVAAPVSNVVKVQAEALKLLRTLRRDAVALAGRELLPACEITEQRSGRSYLATSRDLLTLYTLFHAHWATVAGNTAVTLEELQRAATLAHRLALATGQSKATRSDESVALGAQRQRLFTLCLRSYEQVRRAVTFLRWTQGDVDRYAPSLYAQKRRARSEKKTSESPAAEAATAAK